MGRPVESIVLVRTLAISLVVANHAFPIALHGGMNTLLVVSGIAMAQFAFTRNTLETIKYFVRFSMRIAVPSLLVALVWGIFVGNLNIAELLLVSNWIGPERVALFPIWYVQSLVQMLIALAALFALTDMTRHIQQNRVLWTGVVFIGASLVAVASHLLWNTLPLADHLPHLLAWNFIFGWLFWAVRSSTMPAHQGRWLLTLAFLAPSTLIFLALDTQGGQLRFSFMACFVLILIWLDQVVLPPLLARIAYLTSQATLFIFLFHYYFFLAIVTIRAHFGWPFWLESSPAQVVIGLAGPVFLWLLWHATVRVYRRRYTIS